tara:strand:- start:719 stop:1612 length:894 start_codon:yes stop_codon:yes gene_type:complete
MTDVTIKLKDLMGIYELLGEQHECAGTLKINDHREIEKFTVSKGDADSVHTPLAPFNWHSHPLFLYKREGVCWGWPSGEDMREVIFFGLGGNKAHFVFSAEGVYVIRLTECFKEWLEKIPDQWDRGIVIGLLEMVFKSTHNLRTNYYNEKNGLSPQDWVNMIRRLRIRFFFNDGEETCGKITCRKITIRDQDDEKSEQVKIGEYAEMYESDEISIYKVGKNGSINGESKWKTSEALERLSELSKDLDKDCKNSKLYNVDFYKNKGIYRNDTLINWDKTKPENIKPGITTIKLNISTQ